MVYCICMDNLLVFFAKKEGFVFLFNKYFNKQDRGTHRMQVLLLICNKWGT